MTVANTNKTKAIEGKQIIGFNLVAAGTETFQSFNPALNAKLDFLFTKATPEEVELACEKAAAAFQVYRKKSGVAKATFLESIAEEIKGLGSQLIDTCCQETALPTARIEGERGRTVNQLLMFARMLREGSWVDARIETADTSRVPLPKPDIRYMHTGIGPVVVFGASNFPLAFSVAGGDTASALAAGCPVIVKVHSAHPATGELVGSAIQRAAQQTNMPDGVFSMLHGDGSVVGMQLAKNKHVKAIGLTGSFQAGKALFDAAASRPEPIPVYAEMGSTNPVFVLPEALNLHKEKIAQGFSASVTLGVGQFCTNPGLLLYQGGDAGNRFTTQLEAEFVKTSGGVMLTPSIFKSYPELAEEIFGPASLVVELQSKQELLEVAKNLTGHLTATVHGTERDLLEYRDLIDILEQKAGRIVINGFPTGVEVCSAMVHGGPYPATTDGRSTSVGTAAIFRFTRAVSYQGMPGALLPPELQDENPLNIMRLVNGSQTRGGLFSNL